MAFFFVTAECLILVGVFDGFSWIRAEGKGSFLSSPQIKSFGNERIAAGEKILVVDLENCGGMDSTFMGTLAGLAARLSARDGGLLQIADANSRNQTSLEDLGLDFLMEIDPLESIWREKVDLIRSELIPRNSSPQGEIQQVRHVLEAHQILSETSDKNGEIFSAVVRVLESNLAEKKRLADDQESI